MPRMVSRTICGISTYASVVTSPATWTRPVVAIVSTATRDSGSAASSASRIASLIWSQILSGWPSVTDSEVNSRSAVGAAPEVWGRCRGKVTQLPYWLESVRPAGDVPVLSERGGEHSGPGRNVVQFKADPTDDGSGNLC